MLFAATVAGHHCCLAVSVHHTGRAIGGHAVILQGERADADLAVVFAAPHFRRQLLFPVVS